MPVPFATALAMPLLTGGGGAGAGFLGGAFSGAAFGSTLGGIGSAIGGIGGLFGPKEDRTDYSSLYAQQLAPGATALTIAGQELGALQAPYISTLLAKGQFGAQTAYDQFQQASTRDTTQAGLQAGIASQYASNVLDLQAKTGAAKLSAELALGVEAPKDLAKTYASSVSDLAKTALAGQMTLLNPMVQAQAAATVDANNTRNKMVLNTQTTNLDIAKMQENTRNQLALQRGGIEGQLALKKFGASMALAGQRLFA